MKNRIHNQLKALSLLGRLENKISRKS
uniref:Uncharacterized protein n=1 Tax=Arundo donax TaxID=35708 RepID=A0A0A8YCY4_ARUDO